MADCVCPVFPGIPIIGPFFRCTAHSKLHNRIFTFSIRFRTGNIQFMIVYIHSIGMIQTSFLSRYYLISPVFLRPSYCLCNPQIPKWLLRTYSVLYILHLYRLLYHTTFEFCHPHQMLTRPKFVVLIFPISLLSTFIPLARAQLKL